MWGKITNPKTRKGIEHKRKCWTIGTSWATKHTVTDTNSGVLLLTNNARTQFSPLKVKIIKSDFKNITICHLQEYP